ncbi:Holliday junction DNA helicase RuvA [Pseudobythopirellula maris]|uniref:Holliday junction branch migration complex subunit RuvA n=1 Tax=Pseudobythopirellula maris TaxID=2527991 RepID=A0A5C5ZID0_9BACT|nr:Holliday junction branch migration protein RuvA [Pseudobythopirellula maris]TWT86561.1 Holliday junction DNA helicase RuvA [Pseudobythopirellula maris]
MITKITGKLVAATGDTATLAAAPFEYEVLIPEFVRRQLQGRVGEKVSLHTLEYIDGDPSRGKLTPRLAGFLAAVEREFFEMFCQVDGVGVKKALRAMVRPVDELATLIEEQDVKGLSALPGIGPATAERVVAKLRRKAAKFALMVGRKLPEGGEVERDLLAEAFEILRTLGHSDADAHRLLEEAAGRKKKFKDVEALLHAVYEQRSA